MYILLLMPAIVYEVLYFVLDASGSHFMLLLLEVPLAAACIQVQFSKIPAVKNISSIIRICIYSLSAIFYLGISSFYQILCTWAGSNY